MNLRVVTATRGTSPFWAETMRSVTHAAPGAQHVLVCPKAWAEETKDDHAALTVLPQIKVGLYPNLNRGLRDAPSSWDAFTWINDDDVLRAPGFSTLLAELNRNPAVDVVYGRVGLINPRGEQLCELPVARHAEDLAALFANGVIPFAQPGTVIRRRVWEKLGGIDETYRIAGDTDFFIRALMAGARFKFVNADAAAFRLNAGQLSKSSTEVKIETDRALVPLGKHPYSFFSKMRFRWENLDGYFERIRRHGWISMRELYDRTH